MAVKGADWGVNNNNNNNNINDFSTAMPFSFCLLVVPADIGQGSQSGSRVSVLMFFVSWKPTVH
jgi:hypothetical protein